MWLPALDQKRKGLRKAKKQGDKKYLAAQSADSKLSFCTNSECEWDKRY